MNVLVKQYTGFKSVKHNIQFQPETPKKAKALAESGHVQNVFEYAQCIEASVIRETFVLQKPYETKLWINDERLVTTVSCTCTYNMSKKCKHVAGLMSKDCGSLLVVMYITLMYVEQNQLTNKARKLYESLFDCEVLPVGIIPAKMNEWLCASLDGVVLKDGVIRKIVEFKCLYSCRDKPIIDFDSKKSNALFLDFKDGKVVFKSSDKYYTQCQVQMYVTGMSVYSPVKNGSVHFTVRHNNEFLQKVISKPELFYLQYFYWLFMIKLITKPVII